MEPLPAGGTARSSEAASKLSRVRPRGAERDGAAATAVDGADEAQAQPDVGDDEDDEEAAMVTSPRAAAVARFRVLGRTPRFWVGLGALVSLVLLPAILSRGGSPAPANGDSTIQPVLPNSVVFYGLGDWGRRGIAAQTAVAAAMARWAPVVHPSFVVNVGDSFYETGVVSVKDPQWNATFTGVYTAPELADIPWWGVVGNHDLRANISALLAWTGDARWRMPDLQYALRVPLPHATDARRAAGRAAAASDVAATEAAHSSVVGRVRGLSARAAGAINGSASDCLVIGRFR
jgi:hypothetical protein